MKTIYSLAVCIAAMLMPAALFAHAGHGHDNPLSPGHIFNNPEHAIPAGLALSVAVVAIAVLYHRLQRLKNKK